MNKESMETTKFVFPEPKGPYAIGTKLFELTDASRIEPETGKQRELVVQVWYPCKKELKEQTSQYPYEVREWYKRIFMQHVIKLDIEKQLANIYTHALSGVGSCVDEQFPVVIFGHGNGAPRGSYSYLCEEIASQGFVVLMVMHTYVTALTRFFDGRQIDVMRDPRVCALIETCFADIEFMLNQAQTGAFGLLTKICNFDKIGMVGHSLGGIMTAQVCRRDQRVKMGISLDGPLWGKQATEPFYKPFMFLRTPNFYKDMEGVLEYQKDLLQVDGVTPENFIGSLDRFCEHNGKGTVQITIEGAHHMTFMDDSLLEGMFEKIFGSKTTYLETESIYVLPVPHIVDAIRQCIIAFLNYNLRGKGSPYPSIVQHIHGLASYSLYIPEKNPQHIKIDIDPVLLQAYVGNYTLGDYPLVITCEKDQFYAECAGQKYPIYPEAENKFFYTVANIQLTFVKNDEGKVIQVVYHQRSLDQVAEKI